MGDELAAFDIFTGCDSVEGLAKAIDEIIERRKQRLKPLTLAGGIDRTPEGVTWKRRESTPADRALGAPATLYFAARACAHRLWRKGMSPVPSESRSDPWQGILDVRQWCIENTANGPGQTGRHKPKITLEEANVELRRLLNETPFWDWTVKTLAKKVGCSTGTISNCPAWKAYKGKRDQLRGEGTIKTTSISREMESVLGSGEKDEVLQQLIAEQEEDQRREAGQAKLYLSHRKKREGRES